MKKNSFTYKLSKYVLKYLYLKKTRNMQENMYMYKNYVRYVKLCSNFWDRA